MDISYQAPFPRNIEAFLASQGRDGSDNSSDSNDMEYFKGAQSYTLEGRSVVKFGKITPIDHRWLELWKRFAWDARLLGSSQHLETEHGIEGDAIGGAMSVKLVSWAEPLKITPFPVDVVERNARILHDLYQSSRVHLPPQMEWMFLANLIQPYTGPVEEIFDQVTFYESKQQVYWKHHLKKFFTTKPADPAVHRYTLLFAHGTNSGGAEGIISSRYLAPATIADGPTAVGDEDNPNDIGVGPGLPLSGTNRNVLSNRFTRDLNIDGMDVMDVKLSQVTTGSYYGRDLDASPAWGRDPYLWDNRYVVIKELVEHLAKVVQQKGSPDLAGFSDEAPAEESPDYADPLETVVATINSWISSAVGKERMNQVRTAADELSA
ncbi:Nek1, partial [Symbiodinium necroappetens]